MVRMRARIAETEDPAASRRKLSDTVAFHVTEDEERRWVEPRLMHLLGLADPPPGERDELFSAWRCFFERIAERGTTLMVFEDLQWADPGLLDFIGSMLEWSRNYPILIVTLARPELADKRPGWGADQRNFTALHLEPLPNAVMAELVEGFVRGLPAEGVERIVTRAEGVPLYAVETVRMLAGRGVLEPSEDAYEVVGDLGALEIPETLQALIAARLDALTLEDRSLLQDASVLGKSFTVEGLAAVADRDPGDLEPRLRELVRKEFLTYDADPRSPERGQYGFLQALIREVAYSTLSKAERRRRHLATAHHLESIGDEELAGIVATHYVEAHAVTPKGPDAEAIAARARDWLTQAAERALSLGSPEQALAYAEQALSITPEGAERTSLLERAGEAAARAGATDRAVTFFAEAIELHRGRGDPTAAAFATAKLNRPLGVLDRRSEGAERMEVALEAIGEDGDDLARAQLCSGLAETSLYLGFPNRALAWLELALPLAERLGHPELLSETISTKGGALFNLGRHREAAILVRGALELAEETGSLQLLADAQMKAGNLYYEDDPKESLRLMLDAARSARKAGIRVIELVSLANAVEGAIDLGQWDEADAALAQLEGRELPGYTRDGVALSEAMLIAWRGDLERATEMLQSMAPRVEAAEFIQLRTWYFRARSVVRLLGGELEDAFVDAIGAIAPDPTGINSPLAAWGGARAALWLRDAMKVREALTMMERLSGRWMEVARTTVEAGLAALEGRMEEASVGYRRAIEGWESLDTPLDLALCAIDMSTLIPDDELTADVVARARDILEELGAKPLIQRLAASTRQPVVTETS